ncbi:MAG: hypothetical protein Q9202_007013 [Teloschistes flavicans]
MSSEDQTVTFYGRTMPYRHLYHLSRSIHYPFSIDEAPKLLMICWELDPVKYSDLTCREVERIIEYIIDRDRNPKEEQVRKYHENFQRFALKDGKIGLFCKDALKEAERMNKVLSNMHKYYFMTLVRGKIWMQLSDFQISKVYAYHRFRIFSKRPWTEFRMEDWIPQEFKGKESELPMRALDWAKRVRRDEMAGAVSTTSSENMEWKAMAQKALGPVVITMR